LRRVKNLIFGWLDSEVRVLYLAQGEYKKDMVGFQTSQSNLQKTVRIRP